MKNILAIVASLSFITTSSLAVLSCTPNPDEINFNFDKNIGKNFDTRNAKDTSDDKSKHMGFSNFFTLGDSLSDQGGLVMIAKDELKVDVKLSGMYNGGFSNGPTTVTLINRKLNFTDKEFSSSNLVHAEDIDRENKKVWGKNYSIGGATAYDQGGLGALLMGNTGIYKQSQALVQQQIIHENDLFVVEIGGNDMFAIIDNVKDVNKRFDIMQDALKNIKNSLYTLLNNGAKKIVFLTPPDMTLIPKYKNKSKSDKDIIKMLGNDFDCEITKIINKANKVYGDSILHFDLYGRFKEILNEFKKENSNNNVIDELCDSSMPDLSSGIDPKNLEVKAIIKKGNEGKEDNYFFLDFVHPTKVGHELAMKFIFKDIEDKWINK
ncbi:SGNH/GDSL hydrolase family protein [Spiroplasma monobiae]|uniref:Lipolytic enzyme, GDSL family n=1 Tax=Spiroplasma monobiae MQ-1 TaxID=1336748 RepID=A0A2K9LUI4_SPISQ|nr:SGNH/GDSL hydrolase family protein [Spiroplasma monobiae]AUM62709.1 lipolytic enzyme, GDSL family [Spiroplasma monobiae MQ-1]